MNKKQICELLIAIVIIIVGLIVYVMIFVNNTHTIVILSSNLNESPFPQNINNFTLQYFAIDNHTNGSISLSPNNTNIGVNFTRAYFASYSNQNNSYISIEQITYTDQESARDAYLLTWSVLDSNSTLQSIKNTTIFMQYSKGEFIYSALRNSSNKLCIIEVSYPSSGPSSNFIVNATDAWVILNKTTSYC